MQHTAHNPSGPDFSLPKSIVEAIQTYRNHVEADIGDERTEASRSTVLALAALERAIAEHVADHVADAGKMVPVAAPAEAEIEAWHKEMRCYIFALLREEPIPGRGAESILRDGLALMRQAAAAKKLMECQFGDIGSSKHARYEVYTTPVLGWSVGEPLPNLSVEVDGKVTRYVPEKQGGQ